MGTVESIPIKPKWCLVPPILKTGQPRELAVDYESFPKIGPAGYDLFKDIEFDGSEDIKASGQLIVHPDKNSEFYAKFNNGTPSAAGTAVARFDYHNSATQVKIVTDAARTETVYTSMLKFDPVKGGFIRMRSNISNGKSKAEFGAVYNTDQVAGSVKVAVDEVSRLPDKVGAEATVVAKLSDQFSAQATVYGQLGRNSAKLDDYNVTLAYHTSGATTERPSFEAALALSDKGKKIAISYLQHIVTRRSILNPAEDVNNTQIVNYIDYGVVLNMIRQDNGQVRSSFDLGASWQANKNYLVRAKMGTSGFLGCLKVKTWGLPKTVTTIQYHRAWNGQHSCGIGISLEDINLDPAYEQPPEDLVFKTPYGQISAVNVERTSVDINIPTQIRHI